MMTSNLQWRGVNTYWCAFPQDYNLSSKRLLPALFAFWLPSKRRSERKNGLEARAYAHKARARSERARALME
jgi:hypothetical protein